jgi:hypothetical protein
MTNKLNKKTFCAHMIFLKDFFGKHWDDSTEAVVLKSYYDFLRTISEPDFEKGVETAIATLKFFPSAKELKDLCYGGKTDEQRAFERNSVNIEQKQLAGYDDIEDCRLARENLNLLAECLKDGIPQEAINEHLKAKKPLRSLLKEVKANKQIQIDLAEFPEIFSGMWGTEQRAATAADYQAIAKRTLELWSQGE